MLRVARKVGKFAAYYLQNPRQALFPQRDLILRTSFGARLLCSHENYIERMVMQHGSFEPESTAATLQETRPGQVTVDVGSNVGYYTLLLAQSVGATGQVHAFEPTRWAYERSVRNVSLNSQHSAQIRLNHAGLLAEERSGVEAIESRFSARILAKQHLEQLQFLTLDRYCAERKIERIDFMKVDVDGYDFQVMRGARSILSQSHAVLLCELHDSALREHGDSLEQYVSLLRELGYERGEVLDGPIKGTVELSSLLQRQQPSSLNLLLKRASRPSTWGSP